MGKDRASSTKNAIWLAAVVLAILCNTFLYLSLTINIEVNDIKMKLPMMLRTTTQRGLIHTASVRSVLTPTVASSVQFGRSNLPTKAVTSIPTSALRISSAPKARSFSTSLSVAHPTAKYTASPLTDGEYHKLSNNVLDSLTETFETLLEEADIETLEQEARAKGQGANTGSPASEWDIECAVSPSHSLSFPPTVRNDPTVDRSDPTPLD